VDVEPLSRTNEFPPGIPEQRRTWRNPQEREPERSSLVPDPPRLLTPPRPHRHHPPFIEGLVVRIKADRCIAICALESRIKTMDARLYMGSLPSPLT
jgi:hypothetical protein